MQPTSMNPPLLFIGSILCFSAVLLVALLILPKIDSSCPLPMPPLRSYIFGHVVDFLQVKHIRATFMRWNHQFGDVFQIWIVHRRVVVTAHPADVATILGKPFSFIRPPAQTKIFNELQPGNFQTMDRAIHRAHRIRFREAFSEGSIISYSKIVLDSVEDLVQRMRSFEGEVVNLTPELADTTLRILLEAVLGSKVSDRERNEFKRASRSFLSELFVDYCIYPLRRVFSFLGVRRNLFRNHKSVIEFAKKLLENREKEAPQNKAARPFDVLDVIRELDKTNREQQVSNIAMFAIAGFESSSEAIAWAIYEITGRPEVVSRIRKEVDSIMCERTLMTHEDVRSMCYIRQCWLETLRLHPAAGLLLRVANRDTILPGSHIFVPEGVQVAAFIAGSQRHEKFVPNPSEFLPERWTAENRASLIQVSVPFSCGPERCPGKTLADFECVAIIASIFREFEVELACPRHEVVGISDWTERARTRAPGNLLDDYSWSLPVQMRKRKHRRPTVL